MWPVGGTSMRTGTPRKEAAPSPASCRRSAAFSALQRSTGYGGRSAVGGQAPGGHMRGGAPGIRGGVGGCTACRRVLELTQGPLPTPCGRSAAPVPPGCPPRGLPSRRGRPWRHERRCSQAQSWLSRRSAASPPCIASCSWAQRAMGARRRVGGTGRERSSPERCGGWEAAHALQQLSRIAVQR